MQGDLQRRGQYNSCQRGLVKTQTNEQLLSLAVRWTGLFIHVSDIFDSETFGREDEHKILPMHYAVEAVCVETRPDNQDYKCCVK